MTLADRNKFATRNVEGSMGATATNQGNTLNGQMTKRGIGVFNDYQTTEQALRELKDVGYGMDHISVIGQDSDQLGTPGQSNDVQVRDFHEDDNDHAEEGARTGMVTGGTLGGITGLLVGLGTLAIPGVGPIMLAGAVATAIATTVAGGAIGAATGGLVGGLVGLGIPEDRATVYNEHLNQGKYLVMVDGTAAEIDQAEAILNRRGIREWGVYDVPTSGSTAANQRTSTVPSTQQTTPPVRPVASAATANLDAGRPNSSTDAETVKLHEERLVVDKNRQKIGEVAIGKHTETETVQVSTPVEKERVVIVSVPLNGESGATSNGDPFNDQNTTARVEVFEETPTVRKEAFVREEVGIAKKTTQETISTEETLRREELDVDSQGQPIVDNRTN